MQGSRIVVLAWCLMLLAAGASVVAAATINVPADAPSIGEAIGAAVDGDVIVLAPGTYAEPINFGGKAITVQSTNPDDPAVVEATIIDGGGNGSVVTFNSGEGNASQLLGLTITNGAGPVGGGILCDGASPTISKNLIIENGGGKFDTIGAGLACVNGLPVITGNTFKYNWGDQGGAIYCGGTPDLRGASPTVSILNNRFVGNLANSGGCIFISSFFSVMATGNTFGAAPAATQSDAARSIAAFQTQAAVTLKAKLAERATREAKMKAALAAKSPIKMSKGPAPAAPQRNKRARVSESVAQLRARNDLSGNSATSGAAVYIDEDATATFSSCGFTNNSAYDGGAVYCDSGAAATFSSCTFTQNASAEGSGGVIYADGATVTATDCTFSRNSAQYGGAVYFEYDCTGSFTSCVFDTNVASNYGGAYYVYEQSTSTFSSCRFETCAATYGGALYLQDESAVTATNSDFIGNGTSQGEGGAMYVYNYSTATLDGCTFERNCAYDYAGPIYAYYLCQLDITDCDFTRNVGGDYGHMIYADDTKLSVVDSTFTSNAGAYWSYGGIYYESDYDGGGGKAVSSRKQVRLPIEQSQITGCTFTGNVGCEGGAIYAYAGEIDITKNVFTDNVGNWSGGAVYWESDAHGSLADNDFTNNSACEGGGATVKASIAISGNRFINNRAYYYFDGLGGGLFFWGAGALITGNVFCGNSSDEEGGGLYTAGEGTVAVVNNSFNGNWSVNSGCAYIYNTSGTVINNIFAFATRGGGVYAHNGLVFTHNCVYGNRGGDYTAEDFSGRDGNLCVDPRYADRANCDLHLKSIGGRWDPVGETWVKDWVTSRCIDAGVPDNLKPQSWSSEPMPNFGRINMGAYGGTIEASKSSMFAYITALDGAGGLNRSRDLIFGFRWNVLTDSVMNNFSFGAPGPTRNGSGPEVALTDYSKLTVSPDPSLDPSIPQVATFAAGIRLRGGGSIPWAESFDWTTGNEAVVVSTTPAAEAAGVATDAPVVVTFDQPMVPVSVEKALRITAKNVRGLLPVDGTFEWSADRTMMTYRPASPWTAPGIYEITVGRGSRSAAGVCFPLPYKWQFMVGAPIAPAPTVTASAATTASGVVQVTVNLASAANVAVSVRNIAGKEVAQLAPQDLPAGLSTLSWNGKSRLGTTVPGGQYLLAVAARTADGKQCQCLVPLRK